MDALKNFSQKSLEVFKTIAYVQNPLTKVGGGT